jgi:hypothetical protein
MDSEDEPVSLYYRVYFSIDRIEKIA